MSIYEYDQEKYLRMEREDAKAEGIAEELEENITTIKNIIENITR